MKTLKSLFRTLAVLAALFTALYLIGVFTEVVQKTSPATVVSVEKAVYLLGGGLEKTVCRLQTTQGGPLPINCHEAAEIHVGQVVSVRCDFHKYSQPHYDHCVYAGHQ